MLSIIEDRDFWSRLKWQACVWLGASPEKEHRCCWVDGLEPVSAHRVMKVAVVKGVAWICQHRDDRKRFSFLAVVPRAIANRPSAHFEIAHIELDSDQQTLEIEVRAAEKQPNKAPEPTPGSVTPRATEGVSK